MQTSEINWGDSLIDSRDILARRDELESEEELLKSEVEELKSEVEDLAGENLSTSDLYMLDRKNDDLSSAEEALEAFYSEYSDEIGDLIEVIEACEDSPDWLYGETLINEDYFEDYIKDQITDCYDMPEDYDSGKWPWCHMQMDWSGAADEAKQDYTEVEISGNTFYIRA
jgi:hypothetical protein